MLKNKIKNLFNRNEEKTNVNYFFVIIFLLILIQFCISIFLYKRNSKAIQEMPNVRIEELESGLRRMESKNSAMYSQIHRLQLQMQNYYYGDQKSTN